MAGDKRVAEMTARVQHPYPDGAAETFIFEARKDNALGQSIRLALCLKERPREVIGIVNAHLARKGGCTLGYMLAPSYWGEGLMTEAIQALIDAVFTLTDTSEIVAGVRVINPASAEGAGEVRLPVFRDRHGGDAGARRAPAERSVQTRAADLACAQGLASPKRVAYRDRCGHQCHGGEHRCTGADQRDAGGLRLIGDGSRRNEA